MEANIRVCGPKTLIPRNIESLGVDISYDLIDTLKWCVAVNMLRVNIYRMKFLKVCSELNSVLPMTPPSGGFYLWPKLPCSDLDFARELYKSENVEVLPGSYLSRGVDNINPGDNRVRIALVAETDICVEAAKRIKRFIKNIH